MDEELTLGVLAYGSLIDDPGSELGALVRLCIPNIHTPFRVEFARCSATRLGAPTLVPVESGGASVRAVILVLDPSVSVPAAADLVWRRETRETGDRHYKPRPNPGPNRVVIEHLMDFHSIKTVLYAKIGTNIPNLAPGILAELAIKSAKAADGTGDGDGISYLLTAKRHGIRTPLMPAYEAAILQATGCTTLEDAIESMRRTQPGDST